MEDTLLTNTLDRLGVHYISVPVLNVQNVKGQPFAIALEVFGA